MCDCVPVCAVCISQLIENGVCVGVVMLLVLLSVCVIDDAAIVVVVVGVFVVAVGVLVFLHTQFPNKQHHQPTWYAEFTKHVIPSAQRVS